MLVSVVFDFIQNLEENSIFQSQTQLKTLINFYDPSIEISKNEFKTLEKYHIGLIILIVEFVDIVFGLEIESDDIEQRKSNFGETGQQIPESSADEDNVTGKF